MGTGTLGEKWFVTGAASGIGRAVAIALGARGASLVLTDVDAVKLEATCATILGGGGRVLASKAMDIADFDEVRAFANEVHAAHGAVDGLMNVAGISVWGPVELLEHHQWRRCVEINLMGPIHVIESFVPEMIRGGRGGHIVNVSSAAGLFGLPWHAPYSASKFGLRGISEVLRFDLARHRIHVSLVCPGAVDTGLVETIDIAGVRRDDPALRGLRGHFRKRAVTPEKAAESILRGVRRRRYWIYTSPDVALGHWVQRVFPWPYEVAMGFMNDRVEKALRR